MKIYLVRHGETQWNIERKLQGSCNSPLTNKGVMDVKLLEDRLNKIDIDIIYSSTSKRAIDTSNIIKVKRNIEIVLEKNINEMSVGNWQGETWDEIKVKNPTEYYNYWTAPQLYYGKNGGENFKQVQERAVSFIERIIKDKKYKNIIIVSHGVTVKSIITHYQKKPIDLLWEAPLIESSSLSLIEAIDGKVKIRFLGDLFHLKEKNKKDRHYFKLV